MELKIKPLRKKDFGKAISFAVTGMNFDCYIDGKILLRLYGRYFLYMELANASQVIAAYHGERLVGLLLASMNDEPKPYRTPFRNVYVRFIDFVQRVFFENGIDAYEKANEQMFKEFSAKCKTDGEINFLAADPNTKIKGIGTLLLKELERREKGKRIYLYTDSNCTYQFYEHRGFERVGEREITLSITSKKGVPLSCYLYSKVCGSDKGEGEGKNS